MRFSAVNPNAFFFTGVEGPHGRDKPDRYLVAVLVAGGQEGGDCALHQHGVHGKVVMLVSAVAKAGSWFFRCLVAL